MLFGEIKIFKLILHFKIMFNLKGKKMWRHQMKINNKKTLFFIIKTGFQFEIEKRNMSFHNLWSYFAF
jgi:hypothetical protein